MFFYKAINHKSFQHSGLFPDDLLNDPNSKKDLYYTNLEQTFKMIDEIIIK